MAGPLLIEYAGAVYHVMAWGNQGEPIYKDDRDRYRFLNTLGEACELKKRAKNEKLAIAARLRRETTLTLPWIAARLQMGSWKSLNALLHRWRKEEENQLS